MTPTSARASSTSADEDTRTVTRPDVWDLPGTGMAWCDCGESHSLSRDDVAPCRPGGPPRGRRVRHREVVRVTQALWGYWWVCRFFHLKVEDAAVAVSGAVRTSYPLDDAIDITGLFTQTWQGCPEEACAPLDG